ncbi:CHRNA6 [Branchiostoma lanceolatum]|uniref:CHRNA6 protein n=1 Tax=Branchiostoma lanceolatum TaxID=7740 RepID=A0A8J9Z6W6_BRALA|nr:CHRNA6 [Branchiostoma lanceolatum]
MDSRHVTFHLDDHSVANHDAFEPKVTTPSGRGVLAVLKQIENNQRISSSEVWHKKREDGKKVRVLIKASIISLTEIDTVKQSFSAEVWLSACFKEPLLKGKKDREEVDWADQWDPRIVLFNAVTVDKEEIKHNLILTDMDDIPIVQITRRVQATFKEPMKLANFPFDFQKLTIKLRSRWPIDQVELMKNMGAKDTIRTDSFTASQEWKLYGHLLCDHDVTKKDLSTSDKQFPLYHITMHVKRKSGFYVWNVALLMFLIMSLSFTAFSVSPDKPESRLSVSLTLLLTSVAFKFMISQNLPTISYLTLLDKYVLLCMIFQCLVAVQNALVSAVTNPVVFDRVSMAVLGGLVIFAHLVLGIVIWRKKRKANNVLRKAKKEYLRTGTSIERFFQRTKCSITGFTDGEVTRVQGF